MRKKLLCIVAALFLLVLNFAGASPRRADSAFGYIPNSWTQTLTEISYDYKVEDEYMLDEFLPWYSDMNTVLGGGVCAPVAGMNCLGYYDRYYPDLVPETQGFVNSTGRYNYPMAVDDTIADLYARMGTNSDGQGGTTSVGFRRGLNAYGTAHGYKISFADCGYNKDFWDDLYEEELRFGHPVALFLTKQNIVSIIEENNLRKLSKFNGTGNHVMVGFGIRRTDYYKNQQKFRSDLFLLASTGYGEVQYLLVDSTLEVEYATAVKLQKI